MAICCLLLLHPAGVTARALSEEEISREIVDENNKIIVETFMRYELGRVNEEVTNSLIKDHPSLEFFIKQAKRGPFKNLIFLEDQVHKLRDVQRNIDSFPYSITFSASEKKKILELRPSADKIVTYGIPLMKRDLYRIVEAARTLADRRRKHPVELMGNEAFRDEIYRHCESTAKSLDDEMGKLSEGELICMKLGWTLEQVTITNLWLAVNDNSLPKPEDYMVFRKHRSAYFQKRLQQIYGSAGKPRAAVDRP